MKVKDLISILAAYSPEAEVCIDYGVYTDALSVYKGSEVNNGVSHDIIFISKYPERDTNDPL